MSSDVIERIAMARGGVGSGGRDVGVTLDDDCLRRLVRWTTPVRPARVFI